MIYLTTGLPGAGKTLYTIAVVKELAEKENRPVFYSGIQDLALPWTSIEADKWMDCSDGAIIVIDECQRIFRPRGNGSKVPEYVSALETHRHRGFDIFLVTQHPMLVDSNVRRLTERHSHISRRFGLQRTTVLQFESCKDQPLAQMAQAQRLEWKYPKEVFSFYKSAEAHTVKRRIPMQYYLIGIVPLLVIASLWYFIQRHYSSGKLVIPGTDHLVAESAATSTAPKPGTTNDKPKALTTSDYVAAYTPRLDGLAYTAPIYDEVTKPQEAPVPVACIESKSKGCRCYSQQGTRLDMPDSICVQIVQKGFFRAFGKKDEPIVKAEPANAVSAASVSPGGVISPMERVKSVELASAGNDSTNPRFNQSLR